MRSMTGYGTATADAAGARVTVDIRGVNQRFLDVRVTTPREYAAFETELRDRVRAVTQRGRIEVTVARTPVAGARRWKVGVRRELARAYVDAARDLARTLRLDARIDLADVLRLPDLMEVTERPADAAAELPAVRRALTVALGAFDRERRREGAILARDMRARVATLDRAARGVARRVPVATAAVRAALAERMARLAGGDTLDPARVAHEVALAAERGDVTEELVRLRSHLGALAAALRSAEPVGKRVEFLLQEIHRELNTTGSKSADLEIAELVLAARGEVEKLREQVQNVE
jgi:uncharacterized protein (TIGR00255 family)